MDESDGGTEDGSIEPGFVAAGAATINNQYAVWLDEDYINFQKIAAQNETIQHIPFGGSRYLSKQILALSTLQPNILAVSIGAQVRVYDLSTHALTCVIPGSGRTITSIAWSSHEHNILAIGSVDGVVCLWSVNTPQRPIRSLRAAYGPCESIEFNPAEKQFLASIQERAVLIWDLRKISIHPTCTIRADGIKFSAIAWHPGSSMCLMAATEDGQLRFHDLSKYLSKDDSASRPSSSEDGGSHHRIVSKSIGNKHDPTPSWMINPECPLSHFQFLNEQTAYGLAWHGFQAFIFRVNQSGKEYVNLYSHDFEDRASAVRLEVESGTGNIFSVGNLGVDVRDLPVSVLEQLGRHPGSPEIEKAKSLAHDGKPAPLPAIESVRKVHRSATMKPLSIYSQRQAAPGFSRTSFQLQQRSARRSSARKSSQKLKSEKSFGGASTPPAVSSLTSSLELPKPKREDGAATMPFLSPSIPARQSPSDIPTLEDSTLTLPPLAATSLDSTNPSRSVPNVDSRDSDDSDDETFVEALQGSATFLPGGINVPLPKACGALFAPNGQLLTFFPSKPRPSSVHGLPGSQDHTNGRRGKAAKVSRLFPSFGNFESFGSLTDPDDDSDSSDSFAALTDIRERWPDFAIPRSSFPSQPSWKSRVSPTKADENARPGETNITVNVYEINDVQALCTAQRRLAEKYSVLRTGSESGTDVCDHNAAAAESVRLQDTAHIWNLLGMLLRDQVPLELLQDERRADDIITVARSVKTLPRSDSGVDLSPTVDDKSKTGQLRWANDPLGAAWLIRSVLAWVEQVADIQLLACICAVLTDVQRDVESDDEVFNHSFLEHLPTHSSAYVTSPSSHRRRASNRTQQIPVLRTNSIPNSSVYESPSKLNRTSTTSSRNASQPTSQPSTPFFESSSTTPPFSLPSFSRQSSHLSGSASPEYARSSFSAAAKYYAQSITDKIASYGTSPPTKKLGTSPSASNEFPASLPSGSWSKSVSFATSSATGAPARPSLLSRSYDEQLNDGMYDSDRTIEEDRPPSSNKIPNGPVSCVEKNLDFLEDDASGSAKTSLIPADLIPKSRVWCQYYAEQLRSWDLPLQAAELEKIVGIADQSQHRSGLGIVSLEKEVFGTTFQDRGTDRSCAICYEVVKLMELVCPSCRHVSHLNCLEEYMSELEEEEFVCPTSCGCSCSEIIFAVDEVRESSSEDKPAVRKRPSYTDPRRWRARVEGDSW